MSLVVTGLSHHTCGVELRERLHFPEGTIPAALFELRRRLEGAGVVILSTCNRVEIYAHHFTPAEEMHDIIVEFLGGWHAMPAGQFRNALYTYADHEAIGHLFRVASSLDSLVVGEQQVLGQVHDAFLVAQTEQATDKVMNSLFQKAFSVAKDVKTRTKLGEGRVSISSVAVDLAVSIFTSLKGKTVLVLGSGEMGVLTLRSLQSQGVDKMLMLNRSIEKAEALAEEFGGEAFGLDALDTHLHRADIVVSSTAAKEYVLKPTHFQSALRTRNSAPMFVIDIAVPRDVDPKVNELDAVFLYDMDSLQAAADANLAARRQEIARSMVIVDDGVKSFWRWWQGLVAEPTIVSMVEEWNAIRSAELDRTLSHLGDLTDAQRQEIEYLTKRIVNKLLQRPLAQLKQEVSSQSDPHSVLHLVKRLFGLKEVT